MATSPRNEPDSAFHVEQDFAGRTLAAALREWLAGRSWSDVRRLIQSRRIQLNGNLCLDEGRRLAEGDVVKLLAHSAPKPPGERDVRLQYLDEHLVVLEKPAGITSTRHAEEQLWSKRRRQLRPTLEELLPLIIAKVDPRVRRQRGVPPPVRAVHRLDRETSGLMVFARTITAERGLMQQFKAHTTHRRYLAVARGRVEPQTIESRLVRDRGDGRRGSTTDPHAGKRAVTHVRPLELFDAGRGEIYALVECRLETGRTHQVRVHMASIGHALLGDPVYGRGKSVHRQLLNQLDFDRQALHAAGLGFIHPVTKARLSFESALPSDMQELFTALRV
jgi:23S rRNA pseudouridine1911/1915/1917 synthase